MQHKKNYEDQCIDYKPSRMRAVDRNIETQLGTKFNPGTNYPENFPSVSIIRVLSKVLL